MPKKKEKSSATYSKNILWEKNVPKCCSRKFFFLKFQYLGFPRILQDSLKYSTFVSDL
jgi:hypothetical protein